MFVNSTGAVDLPSQGSPCKMTVPFTSNLFIYTGLTEAPHDLIVVDFARKLGNFLNESRKKNEFKELEISAEPKFLGLIKNHLDKETTKCVNVWVAKDLQKEDGQRIAAAFDAN
jgi:hypothetical protein